jgi:hypothetical protein
VTTVRSIVAKDEALMLKIIALDNQSVKSLSVKVRPFGSTIWLTVPSRHLARAVHEATLPPAQDDFEYYITAETAAGQTLVWPATAPDLNQSVIIH